MNQFYDEMGAHYRLKVWLFFHLPLSFGLLITLGIHIFSVFYYLRGQNRYYFSIPFDREMQGARFRIGKRLKWPDNYFRAFWTISTSQKTYKGNEEDLIDYGLAGISNSVGLSISQTVTRDSRNHPEFPSQTRHRDAQKPTMPS